MHQKILAVAKNVTEKVMCKVQNRLAFGVDVRLRGRTRASSLITVTCLRDNKAAVFAAHDCVDGWFNDDNFRILLILLSFGISLLTAYFAKDNNILN